MAKKWTEARLDLVESMVEQGKTEDEILEALYEDGLDSTWSAVKSAFTRNDRELGEPSEPPLELKCKPKSCPAALRDKMMGRARQYFEDGVVRHAVVKHSDNSVTYAYQSHWAKVYGVEPGYSVTISA